MSKKRMIRKCENKKKYEISKENIVKIRFICYNDRMQTNKNGIFLPSRQ